MIKGLLYIITAAFLTGIVACGRNGGSTANTGAAEADTTLKKTTVSFVSVEHDFGQIREGEKVEYVYEIKNTGDADLLIQSVRPSCGCTTPKYDKKPVRPGRKASIEVAFNTKGRVGKQRKTVVVVTNTEPPTTVLSFTCDVIPSEQ